MGLMPVDRREFYRPERRPVPAADFWSRHGAALGRLTLAVVAVVIFWMAGYAVGAWLWGR